MIKAVTFDLDGTLIQLPIDYKRLFQEFQKIMKTDKINPIAKTVSKTDNGSRAQLFKVWDNAELAASKKMTTNEEGMTVYRKNLEKPKALVTMQGRKLVAIIAEQLELSFDVVITREDSLNREKQLKKAAEKLDVKIQNILFVGNTEDDALAAERAGCQFSKVK